MYSIISKVLHLLVYLACIIWVVVAYNNEDVCDMIVGAMFAIIFHNMALHVKDE